MMSGREADFQHWKRAPYIVAATSYAAGIGLRVAVTRPIGLPETPRAPPPSGLQHPCAQVPG